LEVVINSPHLAEINNWASRWNLNKLIIIFPLQMATEMDTYTYVHTNYQKNCYSLTTWPRSVSEPFTQALIQRQTTTCR